jgi:hypothetical protein
VVVVKRTIFRDMTPCSLLKAKRRFGGTYHFHIAAICFHFGISLGLFFELQDGDCMFLLKVV